MGTHFRAAFLVLGLVIFLVLCSAAWAQTATGVVEGTVKDASAAVLPGVEIVLTNKATNTFRNTLTNDSGLFRITSVPAADYRVEAKLTGFKTATAEFRLDVAGVQTLNLVMQVGDITEVVQVTEGVQKVNTSEGRLSTVVTSEQIEDLPLNGRNVFTLALGQPGVTQGLTSGIGGESGINAAGNRTRGNNFALDGVSNNEPISGGYASIIPSLDVVSEFRIQINNFSAEYGRNNGAIINVITKSGTNNVHGTVYEYHRNDALDAARVFDTFDTTTKKKNKSPLRQHQFGFTIGGPIKKNRTFFFGGYEGFRQFTGSSATYTFETAAFRDLVHRKFPGTVQDKLFQTWPGPAPTKNLVDAGSPSSEFDTPGAPDKILDYGDVNAFVANTFHSNQYNIRVDHEFSDKDRVFGRWIGQKQGSPSADIRAKELGSIFDSFVGNSIFSETHIFSPAVVNEFRYGYNRSRNDYAVPREDVEQIAIYDGVYGFGAYSGLPQFFTANEYHLVDVLSINKGKHGVKSGFEYRWNQDNSDFKYNTNGYIAYDYIFDFAANFPYAVAGRVNPQATGRLPLVGTPHGFRQREWGVFVQDDWKIAQRLTVNLGLRYDDYGQVNEKYGRLANLQFGKNGGGRDVFERVMNGVVGRVDANGVFGHDRNNFSPRIGFAWDMFGNGKTSLRGGFGTAYDRLFLNVTGNIRFNPPDSAGVVLLSYSQASDFKGDANAASIFLSQALGLPFRFVPMIGKGFNAGGGPAVALDVPGAQTLSPRISIRSPEPNLRSSYSMNWFFGIQRELPGDMILEANYVGNGGRKLGFIQVYNRFDGDRFGLPNPYNGANAGSRSINWLSPYFSNENTRTNNVSSAYNGANVSLQKRFSRGLSFQSAYTFGKVFDYNSDNFGSNSGSIVSVNPKNIAADWALAGYDVTHRWASNFIYEIPLLKDQRGFLGEVFGGWQLQGILAFQSGTPYSVQAFASKWDFNGDGRNNDRPNQPVGGVDQFAKLNTHRYIDGVFATKPAAAQKLFLDNGGLPGDCDGNGTPGGPTGAATFNGRSCIGYGDLGRSTFRGPGYKNVDASLFKNFRIRWYTSEGAKLQFRAEFFNLFNRVNLQQVNRDFNSPTFGKVNASFDPRVIQVALKFIF